jgi:hypothetical protein
MQSMTNNTKVMSLFKPVSDSIQTMEIGQNSRCQKQTHIGSDPETTSTSNKATEDDKVGNGHGQASHPE